MSRPEFENRLVIDLDIKRKRVQLSAAGIVGVIGLLAIIGCVVMLLRVL